MPKDIELTNKLKIRCSICNHWTMEKYICKECEDKMHYHDLSFKFIHKIITLEEHDNKLRNKNQKKEAS